MTALPSKKPQDDVVLLMVCLTMSCALLAPDVDAAEPTVYGTHIQSILAKHCVLCHGPDDAEAGLRLDQFDSATSKLDSDRRAIVPTDAANSELITRITSNDPNRRMPPEGPSLTNQEVELLTAWINQGAKFDQHWAYRPVQKPSPPSVFDETWLRNPIDRYVLARLESAGIQPSPPAKPRTLAKRLAYDLTGLPPDPKLLKKFLVNPDESAYVALVDAMIASEHFGERWARHWLDKARYADSDGYEKDRPRPNAWLYRDWVIDAINADMPFDKFTSDQLAGDLVESPSSAQKLATAFHRQTLTNTEGGVDQEEFRIEATFDRTETTAAIWLGLTMTCARCHNHKYDQISQQEYYRLFAFFDDLNETTTNLPANEEAVAEHKRLSDEHESAVARLESEYATAKAHLQPELNQWVQQMEQRVAKTQQDSLQKALTFTVAKPITAKSTSGAVLNIADDGSVLTTGKVSDKDKYTLVFALPAGNLSGIKLEALPHETLPSNGPGRPANGNFVLSELRAYAGNDPTFKTDYDPIAFSYAEADFSQNSFSPRGALQKLPKSGWAISPRMGQHHELLCFAELAPSVENRKFLQVVLDQQYGGKHVLGHFRISTISGDTTLRRLPMEVTNTFRIPASERSEHEKKTIAQYFASQHIKTRGMAARIAELKTQAPKLATVSARVVSPATRTTRVLHRGDFLQPAQQVETDALTVVSRSHPIAKRAAAKPADRLDLAAWLTDPNHPLTPRVSVNYVWAQLFGRGLVTTVNDFGIRGDLPTHPGLLDWLAWHYPRTFEWSRKSLIKTIVLSATYRQDSQHRVKLAEVDPTNQFFARQNRVRVSAEVVRDLHLAVSGLLSDKVGGPSVFPPLPPGVAELSYANNFKWESSKGADAYRRGMYTFFKRTSPYPNLTSFDCPDSNTSRLQRDISNTPLQALITLNNQVFFEASQALARNVLEQGGVTDHQKLSYAIQKVLTRDPHDSEIEQFQALLDKSRGYYTAHQEDAKQVTSGHRSLNHPIDENAAWVVTLRMLTNLDEFIVRD
ncbi:MAG: hypothetical protein CMM07_00185 [Rhodopirellula sp.]|nr:hypothetical protein [Rhodopirellula sp.]